MGTRHFRAKSLTGDHVLLPPNDEHLAMFVHPKNHRGAGIGRWTFGSGTVVSFDDILCVAVGLTSDK